MCGGGGEDEEEEEEEEEEKVGRDIEEGFLMRCLESFRGIYRGFYRDLVRFGRIL